VSGRSEGSGRGAHQERRKKRRKKKLRSHGQGGGDEGSRLDTIAHQMTDGGTVNNGGVGSASSASTHHGNSPAVPSSTITTASNQEAPPPPPPPPQSPLWTGIDTLSDTVLIHVAQMLGPSGDSRSCTLSMEPAHFLPDISSMIEVCHRWKKVVRSSDEL